MELFPSTLGRRVRSWIPQKFNVFHPRWKSTAQGSLPTEAEGE